MSMKNNRNPKACLDHSEKKFLILQEISNVIAFTDNISVVANLILDLTGDFINADKCSLMLISEKDELYILAARGIDIELVKNYREKIGQGIAGTVARDLIPALVDDIDKDERFRNVKRDRYRTKSFISCPIVSRNKLLGVLNTNDKRDGSPFAEEEFELVRIIANQAAIALENTFLINQLKAKALELEEMNRKLIEADVVKTEFLTRISHELRTPLNSIKGSVYYLDRSDHLSKCEQKEFYEIISQETGKLISIVENQLDFLRLDDESKTMSKSILKITDVIREALESKLLSTSLARKDIKVQLNLPKDISDIVADKTKAFQFFVNLIEGLGNFLQGGDIIHFNVVENASVDVHMAISRKLPESLHRYFFSSNQLIQTENGEEKLKLYLAGKIAESHGWNLSAENVNGGFLISLSIPKNKKQKKEAILHTAMDSLLEFISELLGLNMCSIMLGEEITGDLMIKSARGLPEEVIKRTRIRLGDKICGWVALEGKPLLIEDIENDPQFGRSNIPQYNTKSLLSIPLKVNDRVVGVLNLNNKKSSEPFTTQDLGLATVLSERISYLIERFHNADNPEDDFIRPITSFDNLINAEKRYHKKNSLQSYLTTRIMNELSLDEKEKRLGLYVSKVYDLGLATLDTHLLNKKETISPSEKNCLMTHPYTTVDLLNIFEFSEEVKRAILHHHERYDGTGYPDGLKGEEIPIISRVLAAVDAFCAMIEDRSYRTAFTHAETLQEIRNGSGAIFDPRVVASLEKVIQHGLNV